MQQSLRKQIKGVVFRIVGPVLNRIIYADQSFQYDGIRLLIPKGVFHPRYFTSTKLLLNWVKENEMKGKCVLELGCGSGIVSLMAARKGGITIASDINPIAVQNLTKNARSNGIELMALQSDLFDEISVENFDVILINPPFYPKNPDKVEDNMWYCGDDFQYFKKLYQQLIERNETGEILMTLSDDCDFERIQQLAQEKGFMLKEIVRKKGLTEDNMLYRLERIN
tara:strand:+ start:3257 stop:3931 length:675 start_codon:yes stop_codon:yes gene_type:complete